MRFSYFVVDKRVKIALAVFVALWVILFAFRGTIIRYYINGKIEAIEQLFPVRVGYDKLSMTGFSNVSIRGLFLQQIEADTMLIINDLCVGVNPFKLITMRVDISRLELEGMRMQFIKGDSSSNYDFLYKTITPIDSMNISKEVQTVNFSRKVDQLCGVLFGLLPSSADISDLRVDYHHNAYSLSMVIGELKLRDKRFKTEIAITENDSIQRWIGEGALFDGERNMFMRLRGVSSQKLAIPFLLHRWGAGVELDSLSLNFIQTRAGSVTVIGGRAAVSGLTVKHVGLSPNAVLLDSGTFDYKLNVGKNFVELDSTTIVSFNKIKFNPYLLVERGNSWHVKLCIDKKHFPADDLFSSLPRGLFLNLEGIETEGNLSYHLLFDLDMGLIDSLKLESQLKAEKFRIIRFGNTDLRRMNSPFTYTAYERGVALRSFEVGANNPNFRSLNEISPLLQMAVMQSEDGAFFNHNGFLLDCLRDALINDIKKRRFARGGSTISMQLVKNVFLSRHKTVARKAEEALIVWLIEGSRLSSKERMFEVYMNIIEWGPMIYGANEAAQFYFDKQASELNINESIFLASIIPSPKRSLSCFDENMQLKPYFSGSYRILGERLVVKGLISEEQKESLSPEVVVKGRAKELLMEKAQQTAMNDSLTINMTKLLK